MPKKNSPDWLTISQAAKFLKSSRQAVWKAVENKRLPKAAKYGRTVLISRSALAAYKKSRRPGGPPPKKKR